MDKQLANEQITAPAVKLVDIDGRMKGVISFYAAFRYAQRMGMDLVQVSPPKHSEDFPICKLMPCVTRSC